MRILVLLICILPLVSFSQSKRELKEMVVQYQDTIMDLEEELESYISREGVSENKIEELDFKIENLEKKQDEIMKKLNQIEVENTELLNHQTLLKNRNSNLSSEIITLKTKKDSIESELNSHSCVTTTSNNVTNTSTKHFLTDVYLGNKEIQNQEFTLNFEGVIYQNGRQTKHNYGDHETKTFTYFETEYLMKNELNCVLQPILDKSFGTSVSESEFNNSNYLYINQWVNDRVAVNTLFPSFSFTKGKLLTINGKDYLFSISYDSVYASGTLGMKFNLTDDNERGYEIPCVFNHGRIYLRMDNEIMSLLGFPVLLSDKLNLKFQYDQEFGWRDYNIRSSHDRETAYENFVGGGAYKNWRTNSGGPLKWRCVNETEYLTIFKKQTKFMRNDLLLNIEKKDNYYYNDVNSSLYLLFELIEK